MSLTVKLSGQSSILHAKFFPPIKLEQESEICMLSLIFWYSIPNIDESNDNFYYNDGKTDSVIKIPHGSYELEDLESVLREMLMKKHHWSPLSEDQKSIMGGDYPITIIGNRQTMKSELFCRYIVDFTKENSIGKLLGFNKKIYPFNKAVSDELVSIMNVEIIKVQCNLSLSSFENGIPEHSVYEFFPAVAPGYKVIEIPKNLIYYRLNKREIHEIEIKLVDQNNNLINLRGETIHARFHIRPYA